MEKKNDCSLPFQDILVERSDKFSTSVYHKPTFLTLYTDWKSFVLKSRKIYLIPTLLPNVPHGQGLKWVYQQYYRKIIQAPLALHHLGMLQGASNDRSAPSQRRCTT